MGEAKVVGYAEVSMRQKINYIHQNPVKRGYVGKAEYRCYSNVES